MIRARASFLLIALSACTPPEGSQTERLVPARPMTSIVSDTVSGVASGAWSAVKSPFEDIGLRRQPIPEKLQAIADNPYAIPPKMQCADLRREITELDALLGPDICTPLDPTGHGTTQVSRKGEYVEKGASAAREQAVGLVSNKVSIIPYRGAVRYVSGADKHAQAVARAYEAGKLRRAFLKGAASRMGADCLNLPAAEMQINKPTDNRSKEAPH